MEPLLYFNTFSMSLPTLIELAGTQRFCHTLPPKIRRQRRCHLLRLLYLCCMIEMLVPAGGCAVWDRSRWDLSKYRDERASDIDKRLSDSKPIVQNPF